MYRAALMNFLLTYPYHEYMCYFQFNSIIGYARRACDYVNSIYTVVFTC